MPSTGSELIEQYRQIHASREYGAPAHRLLRLVRPEVLLLKPKSILDYGCGQSHLLDALDLGYSVERFRYDPAVPAISTPPTKRVELLLNTDVLEHIPEADLPQVVGHMASLCRHALIFVDTMPAKTILPNGENAHCTIRPHDWWAGYLAQFFPNIERIRLRRQRRAAFRTWRREGFDTIKFPLLRSSEEARYILGKLRRKAKGIPLS